MEAVDLKTEASWPSRPSDTHESFTLTEPVPEASLCEVSPEENVSQGPVEQNTVYLKQEEYMKLEDTARVQQDGLNSGVEDSKCAVGASRDSEFTNIPLELEIEYEGTVEPGAGGSGTGAARASETPDTDQKRTAQEAGIDEELLVLKKKPPRRAPAPAPRARAAAAAAAEPASYSCLMCTRTFRCPAAYTQHTASMHSGDKPYACEWCDWRFDDLNDFKRHLRTHKGMRHFKWRAVYRKFTKLHKTL